MSEPLWSRERIVASLVALANDDGELTANDIMYFIHGMRDEYEAALAEARRWVPPTTYSTGTLSVGDRVYVEVPCWSGADEDAAWAHLGDEP